MVYFSSPVSLGLHLIDLCACLLDRAFYRLFRILRVSVPTLQICLTLELGIFGSVQARLAPIGDHVAHRLLLGVWWPGSRLVIIIWVWFNVVLLHLKLSLRTRFLVIGVIPRVILYGDLSFTICFDAWFAIHAWTILSVFKDGIHHCSGNSRSLDGSILNLYWRCWLPIIKWIRLLGFVSKALQLLNRSEHGRPPFIQMHAAGRCPYNFAFPHLSV